MHNPTATDSGHQIMETNAIINSEKTECIQKNSLISDARKKMESFRASPCLYPAAFVDATFGWSSILQRPN